MTQFVIYDAYVNYEAEKEALEEQDRKGKSQEQHKYKRLLGETPIEPNDEANESLLKSARILERMVNQNTFNEIALGECFYSQYLLFHIHLIISLIPTNSYSFFAYNQ